MKYFERTYLTVLSSLSILLAFAAVGTFAWLVFSISNERDMLNTKSAEREEAYIREKHGASVHSLSRNTEVARSTLYTLFAQHDVVEIIEILETAGKDADVRVSTDAVSHGEDNGVLKIINIALRAKGTFAEVVHFLALLEHVSVPAYITDFKIERVKEDNKQWIAQVRVAVIIESHTP